MPWISVRVSMLVLHDIMGHSCVFIFQKTQDKLEKFPKDHKFIIQNLNSDLNIW